MKSPFTLSERTDKKYTVGQAVASAKRRLKGRSYCMNAISGRDLSEKITLEELNRISDAIVDDTNFWEYDPREIL